MPHFKVSKAGQYADEILDIDRQIAELQKRRQKLETRLVRLGSKETLGAAARALVYERTNTWLDPVKVKRKIGLEGYNKCLSRSKTTCLRVTALRSFKK